MERESKRKAAAAASPESEGRASKRQKLPDDDNGEKETPETTFAMGMKFLETMKASKDKQGRYVAPSFLELPDKNEIPEYYEEIKLPIAFSTIEAKLKARGYPNLAAVESDVKRMVNNAKQFNDKNSAIYADAERVRKTASNFMTKHNPAYKNPSYSAIPTPIPGEDANGVPGSATRQLSERPKRSAAIPQLESQTPQATPSRTRKSGRHPTPRKEPTPGKETDFTGKTFQEAQEALVQEFIHYVDPADSGLQIYQPFVNMPNRGLKEYYATIKTPMSLNQVMTKIRGFISRKDGFSGTSDFKNWQQLEECASLIWTNAREFNEDGSEMYNLAGEFEEHFKRRLADAMEKVPAPKQTIKLTMGSQREQSQQKPSGIKLRLGANKNNVADALLPNVAIHSHPALKLQRPFKFNIPASATLTQQSITISLPGTHSSIQVKPYVPVAQTQRPWRLFVTVNNTRISEVYQPPTQAQQQQPNASGSPEKQQPQPPREKGHPLFEARLQPGVNRIDIEVVAGTAPMQVRGQPVPKERDAVEMEKCTVFVNLMKA
ncbi:Bromodomain containing protein [Neofusicoccum parvum]|uniref:Bromodomain containing protein n=2 Tax=Neofusicoccum parvum TaxID=310453 RepID=A0ACB5RPN5_9PEZI|nr:putative bromodomain containing protein [Neofusicoccum parvum UCRNP2]GME22454.1 Bromodomain containing protein [Neofusicoccum parvum]GME64718.1 Bromodomain containing protein [Neofusicoccum parvum]